MGDKVDGVHAGREGDPPKCKNGQDYGFFKEVLGKVYLCWWHEIYEGQSVSDKNHIISISDDDMKFISVQGRPNLLHCKERLPFK